MVREEVVTMKGRDQESKSSSRGRDKHPRPTFDGIANQRRRTQGLLRSEQGTSRQVSTAAEYAAERHNIGSARPAGG